MRFHEFSQLEIEFIEEALKSALVELEELERTLEWYTTIVPDLLEEAIEVLKRNAET